MPTAKYEASKLDTSIRELILFFRFEKNAVLLELLVAGALALAFGDVVSASEAELMS